MNKEYLKEIIKMFLTNEKETYRIISDYKVKGVSEKAKEYEDLIDSLIKHISSTYYDNTLEIICSNLENKNVKKSAKKTGKM